MQRKDDSEGASLHNRIVPLTLLSPAKINLHLRVGPVAGAGYHPLRSWMITTSLHDDLTFERALKRSLTCDEASLPCDPSNLVWKAADAILRHAKSSDEMAIHLTKRIPAGAGLGGGSSNAATTLVGVNRLLNPGLACHDLATIAATIGSDVPFFLGPESAIATGRGEHLAACPSPVHAKYALLILPPFGVSTAAAYRMFDSLDQSAAAPLAPFDVDAWANLPATELLSHLKNDLERAAFAVEPRVGTVRDAAEQHLGRPVRMSGSGSSLFTLFDDPVEVAAAARVTADALTIRTISVELGNPSGFFD